MKPRKLMIPISALLLTMLACSISINPPAPVVTTPPAVELPGSTALMPAGFIISNTGTPLQLSFYSTSGSPIGTISASSLQYAGSGNIVPVGGLSSVSLPVVVYYAYDGYHLISNNFGVETILATEPNFYAMTVVPGQAIIAYGTANLSGSGLETALYVGSPENATSSGPVLNYTADPTGAIIPLFIRMEAGSPAGVLFTKRMYGIGGDIVFDPSSGLYDLDLATRSVNQMTSFGAITSPSLSPDASWLAFSDQTVASPGGLKIRQLDTGESHTFALLSDSDRGAGDGVFSPDNLHIAWMEGHGWTMAETPDFRATVRLGTTSGTLLADYPASLFNTAAGFSVTYAQPTGWLDNQSVLVQVNSSDGAQNAVLRLNLSGAITFIANGSFTGLAYP